MAPRHAHPKPKPKVVRFLPAYKAPPFARRSMTSSKRRLTRPSIPRGLTSILKQGGRSGVATTSRDCSSNTGISPQFFKYLNHYDVELARLIAQFRTYNGISDSQMRRAIRLIKTMQKLLHALFASGKRKAHSFNEIERMKRRLELLAELKHLADSKRSTYMRRSSATKTHVADSNRHRSSNLSTTLRAK